MIRSVWNVLSTVALANVLAFAGFVLWLVVSDRLDMERVESIRSVLAETRAEQIEREEAEAEQASLIAEEEEAQRRRGLPPLTAFDRLSLSEESDEVARQRLERMRREIEDLQRTIRAESAQLADRVREFEAERDAFLQMRDRLTQLEGDTQFRKTVALYETLRPAQAQALMQQLIDDGETEQVVAYLNKMQPRSASKILSQFPDPELAASLLESLRTYGLRAEGP